MADFGFNKVEYKPVDTAKTVAVAGDFFNRAINTVKGFADERNKQLEEDVIKQRDNNTAKLVSQLQSLNDPDQYDVAAQNIIDNAPKNINLDVVNKARNEQDLFNQQEQKNAADLALSGARLTGEQNDNKAFLAQQKRLDDKLRLETARINQQNATSRTQQQVAQAKLDEINDDEKFFQGIENATTKFLVPETLREGFRQQAINGVTQEGKIKPGTREFNTAVDRLVKAQTFSHAFDKFGAMDKVEKQNFERYLLTSNALQSRGKSKTKFKDALVRMGLIDTDSAGGLTANQKQQLGFKKRAEQRTVLKDNIRVLEDEVKRLDSVVNKKQINSNLDEEFKVHLGDDAGDSSFWPGIKGGDNPVSSFLAEEIDDNDGFQGKEAIYARMAFEQYGADNFVEHGTLFNSALDTNKLKKAMDGLALIKRPEELEKDLAENTVNLRNKTKELAVLRSKFGKLINVDSN